MSGGNGYMGNLHFPLNPAVNPKWIKKIKLIKKVKNLYVFTDQSL